MEHEETPAPEYLKGFNQGYLLAKEKPELMEQLAKVEDKSEQGQGLQDGYKEYLLERIKDKDIIPSKYTDKQKTNEPDKDSPDRD
ncbi:MAG: hypothetical protein M0D57_03060 [Sphingobacteriales bacterium JAD_PAG50586_3]|nr:MAG: hypothetical protein M0D57_03060 [Sphingobacteriales bacterium JAD_PAG50586_3]